MRLTTPEVASIISCCQSFCQDRNVELRLFGHRVSDYDEGNDIGLMFITESDEDKRHLDGHKTDIITHVTAKIGEQPISVVATTREGLRTDPRVHDILPESMFLHSYKK